MRDSLFETLVGVAVVAVAAFFLVFSLSQRSEAAPRDSYNLTAVFNRVDGINVGSDVRLAGKKVGVVTAIDLNPVNYKAVVTFSLPNKVVFEGKAVELRVPDDSSAQILTDGLLGGAYVALMPGGSPDNLAPGGRVEFANGSIDLLTVLSEFARGSGSDNSAQAGASE
jgi:phospholipid/cholesterol/gamma-HCH transport system substrate-binding protein